MFQRITIVCTANICRSPMAEAILRAQARGFEVDSVGTHALVGREAASFTRQVLLENGYDVSAHRARQATEALLRSTDLILAVDGSHFDWVVQSFPHLRGRVHKLGRWRENIDIADPYGGPKNEFEAAYRLITACCGDWLSRLQPPEARRR